MIVGGKETDVIEERKQTSDHGREGYIFDYDLEREGREDKRDMR